MNDKVTIRRLPSGVPGLDVERTEEALKLAGKSLARVKDEVPYHTAFASGSLLIEQGAYQEAL